MAYTAGFTAVTGAVFTASQFNTNVRDNFSAVWIYTTGGDMAYATSATTLSRLAIGTANFIMRSTGSTPAWNSIATMLQLAAMITSQAAGDLFYGASGTTIGRIAIGASRTILQSNGTIPGWDTLINLLANAAMVAAQAAGDLFYASSATALGRLAKGTALQSLRVKSDASLPEWAGAVFSSVSRVASQSLTNNLATLISFDTELKDTDAFWVIGSPTIFTVPFTGPYSISGFAAFANNSAGYRQISMQDTGGTILTESKANAVNGDVTSMSVATNVHLTAGNTVKMFVYQNSGGALNVTANMNIAFLGPAA